MKKIFSIFLLAGLTTLNAQTTLTKNIEPFTSIKIKGVANVIYTQSDTLSLKLQGDDAEELEQVKIKVNNGTLDIDTRGKIKRDITVYLSHNKLNHISCADASRFKTENEITGDEIIINVSDAAKATVKLQAKNTTIKVSDAAKISLEGTSDNLTAELSDASSFDAYKYIANNVVIKASDVSSAKIFVADKLSAKANDAAKIKVKGDLKDMNVEVNDVASVTRVMDKDEAKVEKEKSDSTTLKWKGKKMIIVDGDEKDTMVHSSPKFNHWAGFSVGVNGLLSPNGGFTMQSPYNYLDLNYSRSINFQLNLFQHNFHLYKNYVNLITGFGIEWRRYMLDNNTTLNPDSSFTWGVIDNSNTYNYNKNLLRSTLLQVPLIFDFNTNKNPGKSFHISLGAIGQFMVGNRTIQQLELSGDKFTKSRKDTYNMNPVSVKAHASIGYSKITAFAEYNLTQLFLNGKGPQVNPFVIGIRLVQF